MKHAKALPRLVLRSLAAFRHDRMMVHAQALAFKLLLSLFPFILFILALLASLQRPDFFNWLGLQARLILPAAALVPAEQVIGELRAPHAGLLSTGTVAALWLASGAMRSLMEALNIVFGAAESRPAWKRYPLSLLFTVGLAFMLVAAGVLLSVGTDAMRWLSKELGVEAIFVMLWSWLRVPAALALMVLAVATAYHVLPNVKCRFRLFSAGATLAVVVWFGASLAYGAYVQAFADYSIMYGSIGAAVVLLVYLELSTAALLFGAEINAAMDRRQAEH